MMNIREKLLDIQIELKTPKSQYNNFGKYSYRNCEDILEAVKPLLADNKCTLAVKDEIVLIGDRYYVKATATLADIEKEDTIVTTAYAREELEKKGMDASQLTGATSSYARKYALNGLFCIDDTKDADTLNKGSEGTTGANKELTEGQLKRLYAIANKTGYAKEKINSMIKSKYNKEAKNLTKDEYDHICNGLERK